MGVDVYKGTKDGLSVTSKSFVKLHILFCLSINVIIFQGVNMATFNGCKRFMLFYIVPFVCRHSNMCSAYLELVLLLYIAPMCSS